MKKSLIGMTCLACLLLLVPAASAYQENFDAVQDPGKLLDGGLQIGQDGAWNGELRDGAYVLTNSTNDNAVRYFYAGALPGLPKGTLARSSVSVDVGGDFPGQYSAAGLLYRFNPKSKTYWAFVLKKDGAYTVFKRSASGLKATISGSSTSLSQAKMHRLTAKAGSGNQVVFLVDGRQVASVGSSEINGHCVGLIGMSTGLFVFDNLVVNGDAGSPGQ
jgi:hypothetical protein